ncbi:MAG: flagellar basal-body rod protein FlgF [Phycisphaerales bacterium]
MNYALWITASSISTNMARQDVTANNLANVNTPAFKPDTLPVRARAVVREEDNLPFADSNAMLERLGAGVMPMPTVTSFTNGPLEQTGRPLDLAIEGDGFFMVRDGAGPDATKLTRDGRMAINADGVIVQAASGVPMAGAGGGPIRVSMDAEVEVRPDGAVFQNGQRVGRLAIVEPPSTDVLTKHGQGLFGVPPAVRLTDAPGLVRQGHVEGSGVDPIKAIMGVTSAGRSAQGGMRMIGIINQNLDALINRFARIG